MKAILASNQCVLRASDSEEFYALPPSLWEEYRRAGLLHPKSDRIGVVAPGYKVCGFNAQGAPVLRSKDWQFTITDQHTKHRVVLRNPQRFIQLVRRGVAEQIGQTTARLREWFKLASEDLAENGEIKLLSRLITAGASIPSSWVAVERAWLYQTDHSPHWEDRLYYLQERNEAIYQETLLWGLPDSPPFVLSRQME